MSQAFPHNQPSSASSFSKATRAKRSPNDSIPLPLTDNRAFAKV